jgi:DnaJ-class molecular chaperone
MAAEVPKRDMWNRGRVFELKCPTCGGSGQHTGPVPYRNCLRCGGYGTVIRYDPGGSEARMTVEWEESGGVLLERN